MSDWKGGSSSISSSTNANHHHGGSSSGGDGSDLPLPKGWSRGYSKSQQRYYYSHAETKHTQWHFPTASEVADPQKAKKRAEENQERERKKQQQQHPNHHHHHHHPPSPLSQPHSQPESSQISSKRSTGATTMSGRPNEDDHPQGGSLAKRQRTEDEQIGRSKATRKDNNHRTATTITSTATTTSTNTTTTTTMMTSDPFLTLADTTSVAIIVPYRDLHPAQHRAAHLARFIPHMLQFLRTIWEEGRISNYHIYIVEQSNDGRKFNRGKLLNIGFDLAKKNVKAQHDVFIFHDVDLLPQPDLKSAYAQFPKTPYHIARVWGRYSNNPKYFGGVVSFSSSDFKRINGYPNTFWGWGGEDDELQKRCEKLGIPWDYPRQGTLIDLEEMTLEEKLSFLKQNKEWKCMVKWEALEEHEATWRTNGLADLHYKVLETTSLDKSSQSKASKITVDVKLNGNHWSNEKCSVDFMGDWKK